MQSPEVERSAPLDAEEDLEDEELEDESLEVEELEDEGLEDEELEDEELEDEELEDEELEDEELEDEELEDEELEDEDLELALLSPLAFRLGEVVFIPSGEVRARAEARLRVHGVPSDRFSVTSRVRVGLEARWSVMRAVVRLQDARDFGLTPGAMSASTTGLFEGYAELASSGSFLRVGRQAIDVGTGRLIGSLNWASPARSFDAVRARGSVGHFHTDFFVAMVSSPRQVSGELESRDSEGDYVSALTVEWVEPDVRVGMDMLYRHDGPTDQSLSRRRDVGALSLRADGRVDSFRYSVEMVGELLTGDPEGTLAFAAMGDLHYRFSAPAAPELGVGLSYATGAKPSHGVAEFENFWGSNHQIYGLGDWFGLRNQAQAFVSGALVPIPDTLSLWAALRAFALPEPGARWSDAPGAAVGLAEGNEAGFLGAEVDVEVRWTPQDGISLWAGYALFVPAEGAAALGRGEPMHFGYVMLGGSLPTR